MPRRHLTRLASLRASGFFLFSLIMPIASAAVSAHEFFVGTYTLNTSRGIYAARLDAATGALSAPVLAAETVNPTFLALHPNGRVLYALRELGTVGGKPGGAVSAFALTAGSPALTLLHEEPSGGISLTHLAADATGHTLVAVSYGGGYTVSFPLAADGRPGPRVSFLPHQGPLGPNASRQDKPHAHSVTLSPDNRFALVADLGLDRVLTYRLDAATAALTPNDPAAIVIAPGAGPRHAKFSADGRCFYVLGEIDGSVTACRYDAASGAATPFQHITTLPPGFQVQDADRAAEIRIHPNGKFLYASNRGHDSLAVFAIDAATGALSSVELMPCGGKAPRNFALTPDGAWLVCAHQDSNTLCSFRVDAATGKLTRVPGTISVPSPVCVLFAN
jgi:6-phosphogluconolactonase